VLVKSKEAFSALCIGLYSEDALYEKPNPDPDDGVYNFSITSFSSSYMNGSVELLPYWALLSEIRILDGMHWLGRRMNA